MNITALLSAELGLQEFQVANTLALFDEGATVPFIARYRKERTGSLDETRIRELSHRYEQCKELEKRREAILASVREQGKLAPALEAKINAALTMTALEDLYLPYRPERSTRAAKAKEAGLEPLADLLLALTAENRSMLALASGFVNIKKGFDTPEKALGGAKDIIAERLSDDAGVRRRLRESAAKHGIVVSAVRKEHIGKKSKYEKYYSHREKASLIPSHRFLAILRGERERVLKIYIDMPDDGAAEWLCSALVKHPRSAAAPCLREAALDALNRLLLPAVKTALRAELRERSEAEAIKVFGENLAALLLAPPAGRKAVIGLDPGFRSGCKLAAVDETGKYIESLTIYPHEPRGDRSGAKAALKAMIQRREPGLIAIGNGTAGRESDEFVRYVLQDFPADKRPICVTVSEAGASVYSASEAAIKEFPNLDVTIRGAVSIARRLQDPLSELVKIDPKSIGVGQYQHDVNQLRLKESLDEVVESCVNRVGVDVNLASEELLKYVSGLNRQTAANIVEYRNKHGAFASRDGLKNVPGLGDKKFQQAAGFLRIPGAENPLDNSAVHPESYGIVKKMAGRLSVDIGGMIGNAALLKRIDKNDFVTEEAGLPTITDIIEELERPGRDPREEFKYAEFADGVTEIEHLREGMILEGVVVNVANFGAFVDIGVHCDGLIHISELSNTYVSDPKKAVKAGQAVRVKVLKADPEAKRVALTMKL